LLHNAEILRKLKDYAIAIIKKVVMRFRRDNTLIHCCDIDFHLSEAARRRVVSLASEKKDARDDEWRDKLPRDVERNKSARQLPTSRVILITAAGNDSSPTINRET